MYGNASNNTSSYAHISFVHDMKSPPPPTWATHVRREVWYKIDEVKSNTCRELFFCIMHIC